MQEAYRDAVGEVQDHAWSYGGLAFATAVEGASKVSSLSVSDYFNPWMGDKIALHAPFSGGLTHVSGEATERGSYAAANLLQGAAERADSASVSRYLEQGAETIDDPGTKRAVAASGLVIAGFSYAKECDPATGLAYVDQALDMFADNQADIGDVAANYAGWAWYHLYHNGPEAVQERVDGAYERIRDGLTSGE